MLKRSPSVTAFSAGSFITASNGLTSNPIGNVNK